MMLGVLKKLIKYKAIQREIEMAITGLTRNPLGYTVTIPSQMA